MQYLPELRLELRSSELSSRCLYRLGEAKFSLDTVRLPIQVVDMNIFGPALNRLGCTGSQPAPEPAMASDREDGQRGLLCSAAARDAPGSIPQRCPARAHRLVGVRGKRLLPSAQMEETPATAAPSQPPSQRPRGAGAAGADGQERLASRAAAGPRRGQVAPSAGLGSRSRRGTGAGRLTAVKGAGGMQGPRAGHGLPHRALYPL